jgi:CP2 transcription factor
MIKHSDEIPVSYLNKGQAYSVSVIDTLPQMPSTSQIRYRTFVRVSFEDEEQRSKPGACWQLWKEGRGTTEAHQREGKLLAVEYVDTNQGGDEESRKPQIELEHNSFDGFCVTWCPNPINGRSDCSISVRFNFLSTDFSHSKGVKGIPVRLCAKTEKILPDFSATSSSDNNAEVCYAKVKLFRDHGAERKLANDVAHVKKTIEKLKQQISQAESGMPTFGKRKRSGSMAKPAGKGPGKVTKHKRTWSMDSDGDTAPQSTPEEDLVMKLNTMQDMFSSTRPASVLYLRGDKEDDPDLYPVHLPGDLLDPTSLTRQDTWESKPSAASTPTTSNAISPTSSSAAVVSPRAIQSAFQPIGSTGFPKRDSIDAQSQQQSTALSPVQAVPRPRTGDAASAINVLGFDVNYQPPPERPIKPGKSSSLQVLDLVLIFSPVACFYVRQKDSQDIYYRAVYLMQRTVKDLVNAISEKFQVDPTSVKRVTQFNSKGLQIVVDEEVVRELPEEQDMIVEFSQLHHDRPVKSETQDISSTEIMVDGDIGAVDSMYTDGFEMWLNY